MQQGRVPIPKKTLGQICPKKTSFTPRKLGPLGTIGVQQVLVPFRIGLDLRLFDADGKSEPKDILPKWWGFHGDFHPMGSNPSKKHKKNMSKHLSGKKIQGEIKQPTITSEYFFNFLPPQNTPNRTYPSRGFGKPCDQCSTHEAAAFRCGTSSVPPSSAAAAYPVVLPQLVLLLPQMRLLLLLLLRLWL